MSIENRRHIRFSLDIPAFRFTKYGEKSETVLQQISISGCLCEWDETIYPGDVFRVLIRLPNKNFLPLMCEALYRAENNGIGCRFLDITRFEQDLLTEIITAHLKDAGLPLQVDPFMQPIILNKKPDLISAVSQTQTDQMRDKILSGEKQI